MARHVSGKLLALGVADIDGQCVGGHPVGGPSLPLAGQHRVASMPHPGFESGPVAWEADALSTDPSGGHYLKCKKV